VDIVSDTGGLDVFYQRGIRPIGHYTMAAGANLGWGMDSADRLTIQAGTGADSQGGQRLVTITLFAGTEPGRCITQFSALYQAN
jgi:hypothetical protein